MHFWYLLFKSLFPSPFPAPPCSLDRIKKKRRHWGLYRKQRKTLQINLRVSGACPLLLILALVLSIIIENDGKRFFPLLVQDTVATFSFFWSDDNDNHPLHNHHVLVLEHSHHQHLLKEEKKCRRRWGKREDTVWGGIGVWEKEAGSRKTAKVGTKENPCSKIFFQGNASMQTKTLLRAKEGVKPYSLAKEKYFEKIKDTLFIFLFGPPNGWKWMLEA